MLTQARSFCNVVWAPIYPSNLRRIMLLQKRIIRVINKSNFVAHTDPLIKKSGLLKFHDICLLQLGQFMYSYKNFLAFHLPLCRTNIRQFSIRFQGPKFHNSLPIELVGTVSFTSFKKKLKLFLCSKY